MSTTIYIFLFGHVVAAPKSCGVVLGGVAQGNTIKIGVARKRQQTRKSAGPKCGSVNVGA